MRSIISNFVHLSQRILFYNSRFFSLSFVLLGLFTFLASLIFASTELVYAQSAGEGRKVFEANCTTCHTIGGGEIAGPDLKGVAKRRDSEWLRKFISDPGKMIAEKDVIALELLGKYNFPMPKIELTEDEISALIAFFEEESGIRAKPAVEEAKPLVPTAPPATEIQGSASAGWILFTGGKRFEKGAPACIACHNAGKRGTFGGGTLGPDLTKAYSKYGRDGIITVLSSLPFPTMRPIFAQRMLTPQEQADLRAFFEEIDAQSPSQMTLGVALMAFSGFVGLMLAFQVVWKDRLTGIRGRLLRWGK